VPAFKNKNDPNLVIFTMGIPKSHFSLKVLDGRKK